MLAGFSKSSKKWHRKAAAMLSLALCTERPFGASATKSRYASQAGGEVVVMQPTLPARNHGLLPARNHGRLDHAWRPHQGVLHCYVHVRTHRRLVHVGPELGAIRVSKSKVVYTGLIDLNVLDTNGETFDQVIIGCAYMKPYNAT